MDDHDGIVLSMICSKDSLITGSSDHSIKVTCGVLIDFSVHQR